MSTLYIPFCGLGIYILLVYAISLIKAYRSRLSEIPGPWYGPFTSLHLAYSFSTGKIWKDVEDFHSKYGPIVRLGPRQVWVADPDALKAMLFQIDLPKVATYKEFSRDRKSPGIFGEIRREPHRKLKRFLAPAFTVSYIDNLEFIFAQTLQNLLSKYAAQFSMGQQSAIETDLMSDLHSLALDIMGEATFGRGFGQTNPKASSVNDADLEEKVWAEIPKSIFDGLKKRHQTVFIKRFFRQLGLDMKFAWPVPMTKAIETILRRRMDVSGKLEAAEMRRDLLQHVVEQGKRPDNDQPLTSLEIIDHMSEVLIGGSETTSTQIGTLFLELARNPTVRAKLLASIPAVSIYDEDVVSAKAVRVEKDTYEYLEACIKENLRLHPIASELGRRTGAEWIDLGGYSLPPYTVVCASYRAVHRSARFWPEPLRFWPERWLPEEKRSDAPAANLNAYFPFSAGRHSCIGQNFAWAEMRTVSANILSRFNVEEVAGQEVEFKQHVTMVFATGHWRVKLTPRTKKV